MTQSWWVGKAATPVVDAGFTLIIAVHQIPDLIGFRPAAAYAGATIDQNEGVIDESICNPGMYVAGLLEVDTV